MIAAHRYMEIGISPILGDKKMGRHFRHPAKSSRKCRLGDSWVLVNRDKQTDQAPSFR